MSVAWVDRSVDEIAEVGRSRSRHRPRSDASLYDGEYPFVQTADIHDADLWVTSYSKTYNDKGLAQSKLWPPGTVIITNAGENTGDCAILGIEACFPDSIIALTPFDDRSDPFFLKYAVDQLKPRLRRITKGATQDNLSVEKLTAFKFKVPPFSYQHRIGEILKAYGDLIENNRRRIELLEQSAGVPNEFNYIDIGSVRSGRILEKTSLLASEAPGRARRIAKHGDIIWSNVRPNLCAYSLVLHPSEEDVFSTGFTVLEPKSVPFSFLYSFVTTNDFVAHLVNHATGVG